MIYYKILFKTYLKRAFKGKLLFCGLFHEPLYKKTKTSLTQFSRFAHEIIVSTVMSRAKALIIGHGRPEDTEVLVNSLAHLKTVSLFVITTQRSQYKSVRECRYRSIQKLETLIIGHGRPEDTEVLVNSLAILKTNFRIDLTSIL